MDGSRTIDHLNARKMRDTNFLSQRCEASATARCNHGLLPSQPQQNRELPVELQQAISNDVQLTKSFLQRFVDVFDSVGGDFLKAYQSTKDECTEVWNNPDKMKFVISYLITCGTSKVLEGQMTIASKYASLASYFEQYLEADILNTRVYPNWSKVRELYQADEHTLVSYLKRRIPCSCLDEKYEQVKSITKIAICMNPKCHLPGGVTKRSSIKCCSRCHMANYCSSECQEADWPVHKEDCDFYARIGIARQRVE